MAGLAPRGRRPQGRARRAADPGISRARAGRRQAGRGVHRRLHMVTAVKWAALALCALGCGARPHAAAATVAGDEVTLYRDRALVKQRVDVVIPPADTATVTIKVAAGI